MIFETICNYFETNVKNLSVCCCSPQRPSVGGSSDIRITIINVTAIISEDHYSDSARLSRVLESYSPAKTGPSYLVNGTCEQIDDLSVQLSAALKTHPASALTPAPAPDRPPRQPTDGSPSHMNCVSVSAAVMNYIKQKCSKELKKIVGNSFSINVQPDVRTVVSEGSGMELVTFTPQTPSIPQHHASFVRQRFIVFYQKTASNLMVTRVPKSLNDSQDLQRRFPHLLIEKSRDGPEMTVTSTFAEIAMLNDFLSSKLQQSRLRSPDKTTFRASPTNSREHKDESCPICLESIDRTKKKTLQCKHSFCAECLERAFGHKPVCPTCGKVYGVLMGTQPQGGKMVHSRIDSPLPGYDQYRTIVIHYSIPSGIQQVRPQRRGSAYVNNIC